MNSHTDRATPPTGAHSTEKDRATPDGINLTPTRWVMPMAGLGCAGMASWFANYGAWVAEEPPVPLMRILAFTQGFSSRVHLYPLARSE